MQACDGELVGWFTHQHGLPRLPTVRERTVTAAMAQLIPADVPVLFATANSTLHPDRATAGFDLQFLQQVKALALKLLLPVLHRSPDHLHITLWAQGVRYLHHLWRCQKTTLPQYWNRQFSFLCIIAILSRHTSGL